MRIAMIGCKGIPAAEAQGGGIEFHVQELATRLAARGHEVTVYVRPYANPKRLTSWNGIRLVTLPSVHRKNLDAITHTFLASVHALFRRFDIIHYHGVGPSTLAWIPRTFKPWSRTVVTFHSRDRFHGKWSPLAKAYLAFGEWTSVRFPHATIAVSHSIQVYCRRRYRKHVWHIPNGVNVPRRHPGSTRLSSFGLEPGGYFYTLSRLVPHKAIDDVIRAFARVRTDKRLVIIGAAAYDDVIYERELKRLASKDPRVMFLGHQSGQVLDELIANGYAMIHASKSEGLSVAVLEAMSFEKVVIMSDIPENLELIDHSGIAFKVGDVEGLREVLQWANDDPDMIRERGQRGRELVKLRYSWESVVERTEAVYSSLLKL